MNETKNDNPINMSTLLSPNVAQYIHPDYLQPLPITLDAKKSPLALLAQTCSSIGKDPSPTKSIIPRIEKDKKEADKSIEKLAAGENGHRKTSSNEGGNESASRDSNKKSGLKTGAPKEIPPLVPISDPSSRKSSPQLSNSFEKSGDTTTVTTSVSRTIASTTHATHNSSFSKSLGSVSCEREKNCERDRERDRERERNRDNGSDGKSTSRSSPEHISSKISGHINHGLSGFGSGFTSPGLSLYGHGFSLDPAAVSSAYASSLAAAHSGYNLSALAAQNAALSKTGLTPGLSPYVSYARVRTPSGATTLVPVCRDPYCTNCQLTMQNSHVSSTCTASGCSQCAHEKCLQSLNALGIAGASSLSMLPQFSLANSLTSMPSGLSSYGLTPSLYAHSLLGVASLAHCQNMPYVCNYVTGTDYCGKRYANSEELLQHMRTHSSSSDAALMTSYMSLGIPPPSPLGFSGYSHGPLPAHGSISPNSLRRAYPTIHSPLGSVVNGSRYHPYKSIFQGAQSGLTPGQALASLGTYYSPYSLYGQRIGAAAAP